METGLSMRTEAAIIVGAIELFAIALIGVISWLLQWDTEFAGLMVGLASATIAMLGAIFTRGKVYSQATVDRLLAEQKETE